MFDGCWHSLAAKPPVKYERDSINLTGISAKSENFPTAKRSRSNLSAQV